MQQTIYWTDIALVANLVQSPCALFAWRICATGEVEALSDWPGKIKEDRGVREAGGLTISVSGNWGDFINTDSFGSFKDGSWYSGVYKSERIKKSTIVWFFKLRVCFFEFSTGF